MRFLTSRGSVLLALFLAFLMPSISQAQTDKSPNLATTVPGSFYVDRYAPSTFGLVNSFQGRNDVLQIGIDQSTDRVNRLPGFQTSFYNTQGMKTDINFAGSWLFQFDLFVESSWTDSNNGFIRTDMWATATDDVGFTNPSAYPIIGITNYGGDLRFRGYGVNDGLWTDFSNTINLNSWNTLGMAFDLGSNTFSYFVNGSLAGSVIATSPQAGVANFMFQAYNFNDISIPGIPSYFGNPNNPAYSAHYSNTLVTSTVPEPSTYVLMVFGLFALFFVSKRKKSSLSL